MMDNLARIVPAAWGFAVFCLLSVAVVATQARPADMTEQVAAVNRAAPGLIVVRAAGVVLDLVAAGDSRRARATQ